MVRSWDVPVANVYSGSEPDRYVPPSTTSFCCTGTGPPSTRILEPAPDVLAARPRSRTATRGALARFWNTAAGLSRRLTTTSSAPSPSRSAVAIPCEMASAPAKPHLAPASLNVRSPLLRKATFFVASFGNSASSRRHSSPVNVARMRSHVSASITSHKWPVVARTSSYPSRSTSRNRASHDQSDASIPAYPAICANVPSPRFHSSVLRCHWGRSSICPTSLGNGVWVGTWVLRRGPRPSISTTTISTLPSRSTSEKSTAIEELLVLRTARRGAARNVPFPSLSQNMSGSSKSSHTYRSGAPSPSTSVNLADNPKYSGAAVSGLPCSSRKRPEVHGTSVKWPGPSFR